MFIIQICITIIMIDELIKNDNLLGFLLTNSNFTKIQIDSLLLAFEYKIEGYSLGEIVKLRDSGPVTKGSYGRSLKQSKRNFSKSLYTLVLAIYLGVLDVNTLNSMIELSNKLKSIKELELPPNIIEQVEDLIEEVCDRVTADKVI